MCCWTFPSPRERGEGQGEGLVHWRARSFCWIRSVGLLSPTLSSEEERWALLKSWWWYQDAPFRRPAGQPHHPSTTGARPVPGRSNVRPRVAGTQQPSPRQVLPAPNRAVAPKATDEANCCNLRHVTPKTLQKALYVGFSESGRPPQVVYFGWSQLPFPEAPLAGQAGPIIYGRLAQS